MLLKQQTQLRYSLKFRWKKFDIVNHIGCPALMSVNMKEQLQIHIYFSNYLESSLIWSEGNMFAGKAKNMYFDCSNSCSDFFTTN